MRTPEEVAWRAISTSGATETSDRRLKAMTDLIRDYAKEVAAAQRDVTLVSFEWETTPGPIGAWNGPARRLVGPWEPVEP